MAVLKGVRPAGPRRRGHGHECGIQGLVERGISLEAGKEHLVGRNYTRDSSQSQNHAPGVQEVEPALPLHSRRFTDDS